MTPSPPQDLLGTFAQGLLAGRIRIVDLTHTLSTDFPTLANAIVKALRDGVEDVYPGDVAQEWLERWRDNPKVLERELAAGGM